MVTRRTAATRRLLTIAVALSALVHVAIYLLIGRSWWYTPTSSGPSGTVSIAFVEPVVHEAPAVPTAGKAKMAPRTKVHNDAPAPTSPATPHVGSGAPAGDEIGRFVGEVSRAIDARKVYPRPALNRELEGRVVVAITLAADGKLVQSDVEEPCPFSLLNDAALRAVREVEHYPALPARSGPTLHLHVPIIFKIKR